MAVEKEKLSGKEGGDQAIETRLIDVGEKRAKVPVPREVESWMEKIEKVPTVGDGKVKAGQKTVLRPAKPVDPKIKLPVARKTFVGGFSKAVSDAGRWFSTFLLRLIKIKKGKVEFKNDES